MWPPGPQVLGSAPSSLASVLGFPTAAGFRGLDPLSFLPFSTGRQEAPGRQGHRQAPGSVRYRGDDVPERHRLGWSRGPRSPADTRAAWDSPEPQTRGAPSPCRQQSGEAGGWPELPGAMLGPRGGFPPNDASCSRAWHGSQSGSARGRDQVGLSGTRNPGAAGWGPSEEEEIAGCLGSRPKGRDLACPAGRPFSLRLLPPSVARQMAGGHGSAQGGLPAWLWGFHSPEPSSLSSIANIFSTNPRPQCSSQDSSRCS